MFLVDLMSHIRVTGLYFLKSFNLFVHFIVTKDTNIPIYGTKLWAGENSRGSTVHVLIGARSTTFVSDIDDNVMLVSVRLTATFVVNHLDITRLYLIQRSMLIYRFIANFICAQKQSFEQLGPSFDGLSQSDISEFSSEPNLIFYCVSKILHTYDYKYL
jgi:hypothetical protein